MQAYSIFLSEGLVGQTLALQDILSKQLKLQKTTAFLPKCTPMVMMIFIWWFGLLTAIQLPLLNGHLSMTALNIVKFFRKAVKSNAGVFVDQPDEQNNAVRGKPTNLFFALAHSGRR